MAPLDNMTMIMVMTKNHSIADVKAHLAACLKEVEAGEEVVITRRGQPVAVLVSASEWARTRAARPGGLAALAGRLGEGGEALYRSTMEVYQSRSGPRPLPVLDEEGDDPSSRE